MQNFNIYSKVLVLEKRSAPIYRDSISMDKIDYLDGGDDEDMKSDILGMVDDNSGGVVYKVVELPTGTEQLMAPASLNAASPVNQSQCYYLISNTTTEFSPTVHRTISPKTATSNGKTVNVMASTHKKRDERRRATHNEVERRRRDKINNWIMKLSKILPDTGNDIGTSSNGHFEGLSKGGILAKAFEHITELKETNNSLSECLKENEKVLIENIKLQETNDRLQRDNELLRAQISQLGITPAPDTSES